MPTESSVVSNLIQQVHARRLGTDPADHVLFECTKSAQPQPVVRPVVEGRASPIAVANAQQTRTPKTYPAHPHRDRVWPFMVATVIAGAMGVAAAYYVVEEFGSRVEPAASLARLPDPIVVPAPPAASLVVAEPIVAPAPPAQASADVATSPSSPARSVSESADASAPVAVATESVEPPTAEPSTRKTSKTLKHRQRARLKRGSANVTAKHVTKTKRRAAKAAIAKPEPTLEPPPSPAPTPPPPPSRRQSVDTENPL